MKLYSYDKKILQDAYRAIELIRRNGLFYGHEECALEDAQAAIDRKIAEANKQILAEMESVFGHGL